MSDIETKGEKIIAQLMKDIEPGTPRFEILEVARRFKTSWVELGGKLYEVRRKKLYEQWGYGKFDEYCSREIRIKPRTATKLTTSYAFLKNEEPAVLRRDGVVRPVPDIQVVEMLRRAREKEALPEREYSKIKEMAFNDAPIAEVRSQMKQHQPAQKGPTKGQVINNLLGQARKLADGLAAVPGIPHQLVERALALVDGIRKLVKENGP
jgi:hypothetical protein